MPKTASSLQKWARQQGSGGVKVTLNPDLYVTTYTSGEACLTLDYKPLSVGPYEAFTGPVAKAQDVGAVSVCKLWRPPAGRRGQRRHGRANQLRGLP